MEVRARRRMLRQSQSPSGFRQLSNNNNNNNRSSSSDDDSVESHSSRGEKENLPSSESPMSSSRIQSRSPFESRIRIGGSQRSSYQQFSETYDRESPAPLQDTSHRYHNPDLTTTESASAAAANGGGFSIADVFKKDLDEELAELPSLSKSGSEEQPPRLTLSTTSTGDNNSSSDPIKDDKLRLSLSIDSSIDDREQLRTQERERIIRLMNGLDELLVDTPPNSTKGSSSTVEHGTAEKETNSKVPEISLKEQEKMKIRNLMQGLDLLLVDTPPSSAKAVKSFINDNDEKEEEQSKIEKENTVLESTASEQTTVLAGITSKYRFSEMTSPLSSKTTPHKACQDTIEERSSPNNGELSDSSSLVEENFKSMLTTKPSQEDQQPYDKNNIDSQQMNENGNGSDPRIVKDPSGDFEVKKRCPSGMKKTTSSGTMDQSGIEVTSDIQLQSRHSSSQSSAASTNHDQEKGDNRESLVPSAMSHGSSEHPTSATDKSNGHTGTAAGPSLNQCQEQNDNSVNPSDSNSIEEASMNERELPVKLHPHPEHAYQRDVQNSGVQYPQNPAIPAPTQMTHQISDRTEHTMRMSNVASVGAAEGTFHPQQQQQTGYQQTGYQQQMQVPPPGASQMPSPHYHHPNAVYGTQNAQHSSGTTRYGPTVPQQYYDSSPPTAHHHSMPIRSTGSAPVPHESLTPNQYHRRANSATPSHFPPHHHDPRNYSSPASQHPISTPHPPNQQSAFKYPSHLMPPLRSPTTNYYNNMMERSSNLGARPTHSMATPRPYNRNAASLEVRSIQTAPSPQVARKVLARSLESQEAQNHNGISSTYDMNSASTPLAKTKHSRYHRGGKFQEDEQFNRTSPPIDPPPTFKTLEEKIEEMKAQKRVQQQQQQQRTETKRTSQDDEDTVATTTFTDATTTLTGATPPYNNRTDSFSSCGSSDESYLDFEDENLGTAFLHNAMGMLESIAIPSFTNCVATTKGVYDHVQARAERACIVRGRRKKKKGKKKRTNNNNKPGQTKKPAASSAAFKAKANLTRGSEQILYMCGDDEPFTRGPPIVKKDSKTGLPYF